MSPVARAAQHLSVHSAWPLPYQAPFRLKGEAEPEASAPHGDERQKHAQTEDREAPGSQARMMPPARALDG